MIAEGFCSWDLMVAFSVEQVFGMDLFEPVKEQNDYGARSKMSKLKQGKLSSNSYVPAGLSKAEYEKVRAADAAKSNANYQKNVAKAFKFQGFDEFYNKRGTTEGGNWLSAPGRGHTFAKTKYDFSGEKEDGKGWSDAIGSIFK